MDSKCEMVVFSDKAYNAIIRESFAKHPVETGGILLGHILDNGIWLVMEMVPPGINCVHEISLFEYDREFVNYLGTSIANQYRKPLQVLGLWHRHPGSMDYFSSTDDQTNGEFAERNPYGVISGLVNIDPNLRLTMYHLPHSAARNTTRVAYAKIPVEIGDDLIPESFFELRYVNATRSNLNPNPPAGNKPTSSPASSLKHGKGACNLSDGGKTFDIPSKIENVKRSPKKHKINKRVILIGSFCLLAGLLAGYGIGKLEKFSLAHKTEIPKSNTSNIGNHSDDSQSPNDSHDGHQ